MVKNIKQKSIQACTKTHYFEIKNAKIFWGKGHPQASPPSAPTAPRSYVPMVLKLNVTPPEKNPSYGLAYNTEVSVPTEVQLMLDKLGNQYSNH